MSGFKSSKIRHTISLLDTGVGLVLLWRGIWDLSDKYLSVYASLVLGITILIVIALLEKRQVFKFFGEE